VADNIFVSLGKSFITRYYTPPFRTREHNMSLGKIVVAVGLGAALGQSPGAINTAIEAFSANASALFAPAKLSNQALDAQRMFLEKEFARLQAELKTVDDKLKANEKAQACRQDLAKAQQLNPGLPDRCDLKAM
jgi:hypothetical protein